jgi:hypothetical protein
VDLPALDVVLMDVGRGRVRSQIEAVDTYMHAVTSRVYVLHRTGVDPVPDVVVKHIEVHVIEVDPEWDFEQGLLHSYQYTNRHVWFMGDYTIPQKPIVTRDLYARGTSKKVRLFNFIVVDELLMQMEGLFEVTMPCMLMDTSELRKYKTIHSYVLGQVSLGNVVYTPGLNQTVYAAEDAHANDQILGMAPASHEKFLTIVLDRTVLGGDVNGSVVQRFSTVATT